MKQEYTYMHVYQYQKIKRVQEKLIAIKLNEFVISERFPTN